MNQINQIQINYLGPAHQYEDTKANIEALTVTVGAIAYATDTQELGTFNGAAWDWGSGGGGGGGAGSPIFTRVLSADLLLLDTQCLVITGYLDLAGYDLDLRGDSVLEIL